MGDLSDCEAQYKIKNNKTGNKRRNANSKTSTNSKSHSNFVPNIYYACFQGSGSHVCLKSKSFSRHQQQQTHSFVSELLLDTNVFVNVLCIACWNNTLKRCVFAYCHVNVPTQSDLLSCLLTNVDAGTCFTCWISSTKEHCNKQPTKISWESIALRQNISKTWLTYLLCHLRKYLYKVHLINVASYTEGASCSITEEDSPKDTRKSLKSRWDFRALFLYLFYT